MFLLQTVIPCLLYPFINIRIRSLITNSIFTIHDYSVINPLPASKMSTGFIRFFVYRKGPSTQKQLCMCHKSVIQLMCFRLEILQICGSKVPQLLSAHKVTICQHKANQNEFEVLSRYLVQFNCALVLTE